MVKDMFFVHRKDPVTSKKKSLQNIIRLLFPLLYFPAEKNNTKCLLPPDFVFHLAFINLSKRFISLSHSEPKGKQQKETLLYWQHQYISRALIISVYVRMCESLSLTCSSRIQSVSSHFLQTLMVAAICGICIPFLYLHSGSGLARIWKICISSSSGL